MPKCITGITLRASLVSDPFDGRIHHGATSAIGYLVSNVGLSLVKIIYEANVQGLALVTVDGGAVGGAGGPDGGGRRGWSRRRGRSRCGGGCRRRSRNRYIKRNTPKSVAGNWVGPAIEPVVLPSTGGTVV